MGLSCAAPLAGRDPKLWTSFPTTKGFQSTRPLRGATVDGIAEEFAGKISIHAPLAGCDMGMLGIFAQMERISIHAPLAGCDAF